MRGLNRSTVCRQIRSGAIPTEHGLVNPEVADLAREKNLDAARRKPKQVGGVLGRTPAARRAAGGSFSHAVTRKENALADLREMELRTKRGELVDVGEVKAAWAEIGVAIRDAVLRLPSRICERLSVEIRRDVLPVAQEEARAILTALSDRIRSPR
jgi:phage terminase Nu1 subunit (DNA packaging protein)